jgi:hypothetical protein
MSKGLRKFYEAQNEILDGFQEVDEILDNARAKAATGELTPLITVNFFSSYISYFATPPNLSVLTKGRLQTRRKTIKWQRRSNSLSI